MISAVYQIRHEPSGRVYVGSSVNAAKRLRQHFRQLERGTHCNFKLQHAWNKYGAAAFSGRLLIQCSRQDLLMFEDMAIAAFDAVRGGFNICTQGRSALGLKRSKETAQKISAAITGKRHTDEARRLMSEAKRGRKMSEEQKVKISATLAGRKFTPEHCKAISLAKKGETPHEATREAVSASNRRRARAIKETGDGRMGWYSPRPPST